MHEQMAKLGGARGGDAESIAIVRKIMRNSVENAPAPAIIEIARHRHDHRIAAIRGEVEAN
jgi:hypothetical protein